MSDLSVMSIWPIVDDDPPSLAAIRSRIGAVGNHSWEVVCDASTDIVGVRGGDYDDADLIAHAPADIAWLLNELDTARERVAILRAEVSDLEALRWARDSG